jgi:cell division control protein 6
VTPYRSVFKDEAKLDINYVPDRLPHREKEKRLLTEFFDFLLRFPERMTQRVLVTGDVGTGKTALCQRFGQDITLEANKRGINLRYVHVNCREYRGSLTLILHHVVTVFRPAYPVRGYSAEEILKTLMQVLDEEKAVVILSLDEFDSLIERGGSEAVYSLTRLQEMRPGKGQRISLIGILRDLSVIDGLDSSARSTLQRNFVCLEKYGQSQLVDILNDRVSLAFESSTVLDDSLDLIAELAFSETGNARFAIELLWRAGKYADAADLDSVLPECVRRAMSSIVPTVRKSELASLGFHEKLFLLAVARIFKDSQKAHATLSEAEKTYAVLCEEFNKRPSSHTQIWKYAQLLSALGILRTEVLTAGLRGRQTSVSLPSVSAVELEKELLIMIEKEK